MEPEDGQLREAPRLEDTAALEAATRRVDEALKERAMDEAPVGITIADPDLPDNPLIYVNENFERMTGYAREEIIGRNCRFLQGPASDPDAVAEMREAIDAGERVSVDLKNYREDGTTFWNRVDIAPIREDGEVAYFVGFQMDITARREAELAVERERRNLAHLLDRVNGLLRDVTEAVVGADSREAIERAVCERLAATEPYVAAWVGEHDLGSDTLRPRAWAGDGPDLAEVALDVGADDPTARAARARDLQVGRAADREGDGGPAGASAGVHAALPEGGALAAVPLVYRETLYGVLTVYAADADAFDERETVVLEALAGAAATAINAVETRRLLTADNVIEVELGLGDPDLFFVAVSGAADCTLEYQGSVYRTDGDLLLFFTAEGAPAGAIERAAADCPEVREVTPIADRDGESLFEFRVGPDALVARLAEQGAETRAITAEGGVATLELRLPEGANARGVVDAVRERHPGTELLAYRERQRPTPTRRDFVAALEDRLTERQLTALQKAFFSGYFDSSRPVTGDDLAESMGISRATFHQHLRAAQRKLVGEFLRGDPIPD